MSTNRTTYSASPGCLIVLCVVAIWIGLLIGLGIEIASRLL